MDRLSNDQFRPDLDMVDPRHSDGCAMKDDVRIASQPVAHLGNEGRVKIVHHDVNLGIRC